MVIPHFLGKELSTIGQEIRSTLSGSGHTDDAIKRLTLRSVDVTKLSYVIISNYKVYVYIVKHNYIWFLTNPNPRPPAALSPHSRDLALIPPPPVP